MRTSKTSSVLRLAGLSVVLSAALLGACNHKGKECDELIGVMNKQGDSIRGATKKLGQASEDITAIQAVAGAMEKAASSVEKVKLTDKKLEGFAGAYGKLMRNGAKAARNMAESAKKGDVEQTKLANEQIRKSQQQEAKLVKEINAYCAP